MRSRGPEAVDGFLTAIAALAFVLAESDLGVRARLDVREASTFPRETAWACCSSQRPDRAGAATAWGGNWPVRFVISPVGPGS